MSELHDDISDLLKEIASLRQQLKELNEEYEGLHRQHEELLLKEIIENTPLVRTLKAEQQTNANLQQQLTTAQEEIIRLRSALETTREVPKLISAWWKEDEPTQEAADELCNKISARLAEIEHLREQALSTPPTGGLSELIESSVVIANWMRWWLDNNECDCENGHICGKNERLAELERFEQAYNKVIGGE